MIRFNLAVLLSLFLIFNQIGLAEEKKKEAEKSQTEKAQRENMPPKPEGYPGNHWDIEDIGNRDVGKGLNFYSIEKEIKLGQQIARQIEQYAKVVDDPIIAEYVNRVGQNIVRNSDSRVPFTIKVLDDESVNAFALPGGFFFVNTGLILKVDNESELAGVMAHEISHVTARHSMKQMAKAQIASLATIPLIIFTGQTWTGYAIYQGVSMGIPIAFLKFSRNYENESDELGLQYLWKSGYDPGAMPEVFEKLAAMEKRKKGTLVKIFSTHPPNEERAKRTQKLIGFFPAMFQYAVDTNEFQNVQARVKSFNDNLRRKDKEYDDSRPKLRKKDGEVILPPEEGEENKKEGEDSEDDRPVLKRKENPEKKK